MGKWFICNQKYTKCHKIKKTNYWYYYVNDNKFNKDSFILDDDDFFLLLDGFILNKNSFISDENSNWCINFKYEWSINKFNFVKKLRGSFNIIIIDKQNNQKYVFVDQLGERVVFYYDSNIHHVITSDFFSLIDFIKIKKLPYSPDIIANKQFLYYGFLVDNSTHIKEIKRIFPGNYLEVECMEEKQYFRFSNCNVLNLTQNEYIELIDKTFRNALKIEFDKDIEYGFEHLVDISGGMDARVINYVANEMGYSKITNICYSQNQSFERVISERIVNSLGNDYIFKSLNNANFVFDVDEIVKKNFGLTFYLGTTGCPKFLNALNQNVFGIEHTGLLGDIYEGSFCEKAEYTHPYIDEKYRFSKFAKFGVDIEFLNNYEDHELFLFYTRGVLAGVTTHLIRQHYFETYSPFEDVDFLSLMFSIPLEERIDNQIFLKWLEKKYPNTFEHPYARTMSRIGTNKAYEKTKFFTLRVINKIRPILSDFGFNIDPSPRLTMNPTEFWKESIPEISIFISNYINENIHKIPNDQELLEYFIDVRDNGTLIDQSIALTLLSIYKQFF